jgi:hypothetical protein
MSTRCVDLLERQDCNYIEVNIEMLSRFGGA